MNLRNLTDEELVRVANATSGLNELEQELLRRWDQREDDHAQATDDANQEADQAIERLENVVTDAREAVEALMDTFDGMTNTDIESALWRIREDLY